MTPVELIAKARSGVARISLEKNREVLGCGTGFLVTGGIVTCSHNLPFGSFEVLVLKFESDGSGNSTSIIRYEADGVKRMIGAWSDESESDHVFLRCEEKEFERRHRFEFVESSVLRVGQQVVFLGFPFGGTHLTSHVGYISSIHETDGVKVIQLDGSVNMGNSGGPLLETGSGKVAGLIARSETGLIKQAFDQLLKSFDENLRFLKERTRKGVSIGGVDPVEVTEVTQNQLRSLAVQIRRSANVGIGFAFATDALRAVVPPAS